MEKSLEILDYVKSLVPTGKETIDTTSSLFDAQILDSMALAELLGFLEDKYHINMGPMDITPENLDSVEKITSYVDRKLASD